MSKEPTRKQEAAEIVKELDQLPRPYFGSLDNNALFYGAAKVVLNDEPKELMQEYAKEYKARWQPYSNFLIVLALQDVLEKVQDGLLDKKFKSEEERRSYCSIKLTGAQIELERLRYALEKGVTV